MCVAVSKHCVKKSPYFGLCQKIWHTYNSYRVWIRVVDLIIIMIKCCVKKSVHILTYSGQSFFFFFLHSWVKNSFNINCRLSITLFIIINIYLIKFIYQKRDISTMLTIAFGNVGEMKWYPCGLCWGEWMNLMMGQSLYVWYIHWKQQSNYIWTIKWD